VFPTRALRRDRARRRILATGRCPHALFDFMEGIIRYENRVAGYALLLATDEYPPFRLGA
jgi:hypothetical protein